MRIGRIAFLLLSITAVLSPASAQYTLTTLHAFSAVDGQGLNVDGALPSAFLALGSDGNYYGTAQTGGTTGQGSVFKISPAGVFTVIHSFAGYPTDGANPQAVLARGSDGNFYGTTTKGGASGTGAVFKITPSGVETVLHSFVGYPGDGGTPQGGLLLASDGNFYGCTMGGGSYGNGALFKMTTDGSVAGTSLLVLHSFSGPEGSVPAGALIQGVDGNFYGTTIQGGANAFGVAFKMVTDGTVAGTTVTVLHSFAAADGEYPQEGLLYCSNAKLFYGTAVSGGSGGLGTVFTISPAGTLVVLHSFVSTEGNTPLAGLIQGSDGNVYGTTSAGGAHNAGSVFCVAASGTLTTLYSFTGGADGSAPNAGVIQGSDGNFYGTAFQGGVNGEGTIFKLTKPAGSIYALWNNSGEAGLWKIPATGSVVSASFGPYSGWTPIALNSDTSGNAYILWISASGQACIWQVSSSLSLVTSQALGPYLGWVPKSLAVGPDGHVHLLWNHTSNNSISIFNIQLNSSVTAQAYGPYAGWEACQIAVDSANNTRVLWSDSALYEAALWSITSGGVLSSSRFGPYLDWQAQYLAVGSDNLARIIWNHTSTSQVALHTISSTGFLTSLSFGPYSGWQATGLAVNANGDSDLMWVSASNQLSLFDIGSTGTLTSEAFGPYTGWIPIALAPGP